MALGLKTFIRCKCGKPLKVEYESMDDYANVRDIRVDVHECQPNAAVAQTVRTLEKKIEKQKLEAEAYSAATRDIIRHMMEERKDETKLV